MCDSTSMGNGEFLIINFVDYCAFMMEMDMLKVIPYCQRTTSTLDHIRYTSLSPSYQHTISELDH